MSRQASATIEFGDPTHEATAAVRQRWQAEVRRLIALMASHVEAYNCMTGGVEIAVLPNVFSPAYFTDSEWFSAEVAKLAAGRRLLDIGTGTGIVALTAGLAGAEITATDINPHAVENARLNLAAHNVQGIVAQGDIYDAVLEKEKFDIIFWNHPFNLGRNKDEDVLSLCGFDYEYQGVRKFISGASRHLAPAGRLLLGTSTFAEVALIAQIASENGYGVRVLKRKLAPLQWSGRAVTELRICEFFATRS